MKLLLDLGNSRCKFAILDDNGVMEYGTQNYGPFGKLYTVKSLCEKQNLTKVVVCSVLSDKMNTDIIDMLSNKDGYDVFFLAAEKNCFGIKLSYDEPSAMGVDRVSALIAVKEIYPGNSCVVDCGTAVTIDAINCRGIHLGGVILPGVKAMQNGLLDSTKIEHENRDVNFNIFANTTEHAIFAGCMSAVAGGIEYVVNKMSSDYDVFDQIIFTGGDAEDLQSYVNLQVQIDSTLVLDGLKVIAENL